MENSKIHINIAFDQLVDIVKQLSDQERIKLRKEILKNKAMESVSIKDIKEILKESEHNFILKIGKFTNSQRTADAWAEVIRFSAKEMPGLFGIKFGCFRNELEEDYSHLGMNLFVIEEGVHPKNRQQILSFFKSNLKKWVQVGNRKFDTLNNSYSNLCVEFTDHETGMRGKAFLKYRSIEKFYDEFEIKDFFDECINGLVPVFNKIKDNPKGIFDHVFRAAPPYEKILEICAEKIKL